VNRKSKLLAGTTIGIVALVSVTFFFSMHMHDTENRLDRNQIPKELEKSPLTGTDPLSDQYVRELQKYYGATISEKSTQAALIGLRDYFAGSRGANGKALFYTVLKRAFPDHADAVMNTLDKLDRYNRWLMDNRKMLSGMSPEERVAALWEKRRELFGEDAEKIWSGEMLATEARKAKVQDTLAILNESGDTTMDEKIDVYQGALREAYEGTPERYILDQDNLLAKVFFSIDSVQEELKQMSPEKRQLEINRIRRKLGLTEQQVEAMAHRDADNALRWEAGLQYMKDREAVVQQYTGPEQEEKLNELREQYFDDEAKTIELEEKDDFFRFNRPHIYGRN